MRIRRWVVAGGLFAVLGLGLAGTALAGDSDLGAAACDSTVSALEKQLARATLLGNIFAVSGGAIVTALPKTLADRAELQRRISLADQHRDRGEKTVLQIPLLKDAAFVDQCRQYAISRFVDCQAEDPPKEVPELPRESPRKEMAEGEPGGTSISRGIAPAPPPGKPHGGEHVLEHVEAIRARPAEQPRERIMKK